MQEGIEVGPDIGMTGMFSTWSERLRVQVGTRRFRVQVAVQVERVSGSSRGGGFTGHRDDGFRGQGQGYMVHVGAMVGGFTRHRDDGHVRDVVRAPPHLLVFPFRIWQL